MTFVKVAHYKSEVYDLWLGRRPDGSLVREGFLKTGGQLKHLICTPPDATLRTATRLVRDYGRAVRRPYLLAQACDGSIAAPVFALFLDFCARHALDAQAIYDAAYPGEMVLEPWPQPLVNVVWGDQGAGVVSSIEHVDVLMKPIGYGQLWYGGELGVLWEAYFEPPVKAHPEHGALLHRFWSLCEAYLAARGVWFVHTYSRDLAFDEDWYATFLHERGYRREPSREHLPGGSVAVVKDLGVREGERDG